MNSFSPSSLIALFRATSIKLFLPNFISFPSIISYSTILSGLIVFSNLNIVLYADYAIMKAFTTSVELKPLLSYAIASNA